MKKEHALAIGKRSNLGLSQLSSIGTERSPVSPFVYEETSKSSSIFPARLEVSVATRIPLFRVGRFEGSLAEATEAGNSLSKMGRRSDLLPKDSYSCTSLSADGARQSEPALYDHRTVSISAISVLAAASSGIL